MRKSGKALCAVTQNMASDDAKKMIDLGVTALMVGSDQGFVRSGALRAARALQETGETPGSQRGPHRRAAERPSQPPGDSDLSILDPRSSIGLREIILWMSSSE